VVERGFAWLHAVKRLRTRYGRRADIHLGLLQLACALISYRQLRVVMRGVPRPPPTTSCMIPLPTGPLLGGQPTTVETPHASGAARPAPTVSGARNLRR
jgi:hypothetical protein